jgi:ATP dependent DNA ligase-like protein
VSEQVPAGTVLDGELVIDRDGRCDFAALQQHMTRRARSVDAATFVAFDLLTLAGRDLRGLPYRKRRKRLRRLLAQAVPPLALMPATRELAGARAWMRNHTAAALSFGERGWRHSLPDVGPFRSYVCGTIARVPPVGRGMSSRSLSKACSNVIIRCPRFLENTNARSQV